MVRAWHTCRALPMRPMAAYIARNCVLIRPHRHVAKHTFERRLSRHIATYRQPYTYERMHNVSRI